MKNGILTYELDGHLIANPIIGANVKLDLLALGSKFKPWGAIIDALDLASWLTNALSGGRIEFNYELYFQLTAEIKLVGSDSKDGNNTEARIIYNFDDRKLSGSIALQGILKGVLHASISLKLYVKEEKNRSFNASTNNRELAGVGVGAEASTYVSLTLGVNFGKNNNWDGDFYFAGVTLKVWYEAGFNKKGAPKSFEIIPDLKKTINIFENKGEAK